MISKEKKSTNTWMTKLFTVQMPENWIDFTLMEYIKYEGKNKNKRIALSGNRTRVESMATTHRTTRPIMLCYLFHLIICF